MAFTTHGHHIKGTRMEEAYAEGLITLERCGGLNKCEQCKTEAAAHLLDVKIPRQGGPSLNYQEGAKIFVVNYYNSKVEVTDNFQLTVDDVYVVWFAKTLQNWKALASTTVHDGMYYELTYNGDKKELYIDAYKKFENSVIRGV